MAKTVIKQLVLTRRGQTHIFRYPVGYESFVMEILMEKANDRNCPLDWFDAAVLTHQMGLGHARQMYELIKGKTGFNQPKGTP